MSEGFSVKVNCVRDIGSGLLDQSRSMDAFRDRVENVNVTYGEVASYAYELSRTLKAIAERLGEQGKDFRQLSGKLEEIIARYEGTEKAILEGSIYTGTDQKEDVQGALPNEVSGLDELLDVLDQLGNETKGAGWLVTMLDWLKQLEAISSDLPLSGIGKGLTIAGLLVSIANDTLTNIKNGASVNTIIADIISEVGLTVGELAIQTGCKVIGKAIGSAVPVVGTVIGGIAGEAIGGVFAEAFEQVMKWDPNGTGDTGFNKMSDSIESVLNDFMPDGKEPLVYASA